MLRDHDFPIERGAHDGTHELGRRPLLSEFRIEVDQAEVEVARLVGEHSKEAGQSGLLWTIQAALDRALKCSGRHDPQSG